MSIDLIGYDTFSTAVVIGDSGSAGYPPTITMIDGIPVSVSLELQSSLGALLLPRLTTTEMNSLNATDGMIIFNTTATAYYVRQGSVWMAIPTSGSGTITSVGATSSTAGLTITGSPITSSGSFTFSLGAELVGLSALSANGIITRTAAGTYVSRTISGGTNISVSNGIGVAGNPTISISSGELNQIATLATAGIVVRKIDGSYLTRGISAGTNISVTDSTGALGDPTISLSSADLNALAALSTTGIAVRTGAGTWVPRTLTAGTGMTISNPDGVSAAPNISLSNTTVTPGSYTNLSATIDQQGRITLAASGSGGGAPTTSKYLLQVADGSLPNAQAMGALTTGLVKNTTTTGVQSIATAGNDYYSPGNPTIILDTGASNQSFYIGTSVGNVSFSGNHDVGAGFQVLTSLTTGSNNSAIGANCGNSLTTGSSNFIGGALSFMSAIASNDSISIGKGCLTNLVVGDENSIVSSGGYATLTNGSRNSGLGFQCMNANSVSGAVDNTSIGWKAGFSGQGSQNTYLGSASGRLATVTTSGTFVGYNSGPSANSLTNASTFGANSIVAVSNAVSIGSGAYVGINNASPTYSLDIENISTQCAIHLADSTTTPTTPSSGLLLFSTAGIPKYMTSTGVSTTIGTVTSVGTGAGLTGGPITGAGTIAIASTAVVAGSYVIGNFTVGTDGRLTAASNGTLHATNVSNVAQILMDNTTTTPPLPVGGGTLYVESGALIYKGPNGTITTIAPA